MAKLKKNRKESARHYEYLLERIVQFSFSYKAPSRKPDSFQVSFSIEPLITNNLSQNFVNIRLKLAGTVVGVVDGITFNEDTIFLDNVFVFKVKDLDKFLTKKDGQDIFEGWAQPMLLTFVSIGVSSLRGILYEKLRGTLYHDKYLPVIDPNVFFKQIDETEVLENNT